MSVRIYNISKFVTFDKFDEKIGINFEFHQRQYCPTCERLTKYLNCLFFNTRIFKFDNKIFLNLTTQYF